MDDITMEVASQQSKSYLLEGSLDQILGMLAHRVGQYPRKRPGRLRIDGKSLEFVDLHSFYHQAVQIFKSELYSFKSCRPDPLIIDGGAHIGLSSLYFSQKYPQSRIVAFEADQTISKVLRHNLDAFGCDRVDVHSKAVWVHEDGVSFNASGDDSGYVISSSQSEKGRIPSMRLRSVLRDHQVDLLKLDIEGAEFDVIQDCRDVLFNVRQAIIEIHKLDHDFGSIGDLFKVFDSQGFQYVLGDLHAADWLPPSLEPPFRACSTNKYIVTLFAWRPDPYDIPTVQLRSDDVNRFVKVTPHTESESTLASAHGLAPPIRKHHSKALNVVHLSSQDFGGAGKAAYRTHKGLQAVGINSTMLVLNKKSGDPRVKVLPPRYSGQIVNCLDVPAYNSPIWLEHVGNWYKLLECYPKRPPGLELFTDTESNVRIDLIREIATADIIHLHWVAGAMNYTNVGLTMKHKPIVWTLHDMNPFTGGCHYAGDCLKYRNSCGACPQLGSNDVEDHSRKIWTQKQYAIQNLNIHVVTPSRWLGRCAQESAIFTNQSVQVIPNGFPLDIFKPYPKMQIRKASNLPESAKIILFGADSVANQRKGFVYLLSALNRFSLKEGHEYILVTFGSLPEGIKIPSKYKLLHAGQITDENQLALIYSAADIFVLPSMEDNLPNTAIEALACGTPVVGFQIGGLPDMVEHRQNGYLAKPKDVADLMNGINWVISEYEKGVHFTPKCTRGVEKNFALEMQACAYGELYERLTQNS
jgi:FkbM family methyltransferase